MRQKRTRAPPEDRTPPAAFGRTLTADCSDLSAVCVWRFRMYSLAGHLSWHDTPGLHWDAPGLAACACTARSSRAVLGAAAPDDVYAQPDARRIVAVHARIDNAAAVWAQIRHPADPALPPPPAHLIACAYATWGADLGRHVLGDYALAIWEERTRRLVLIRDAIGVYPLRLHIAPGRVLINLNHWGATLLGTLFLRVGRGIGGNNRHNK